MEELVILHELRGLGEGRVKLGVELIEPLSEDALFDLEHLSGASLLSVCSQVALGAHNLLELLSEGSPVN